MLRKRIIWNHEDNFGKILPWEISDLHHGVIETFTLLGFYTALVGSSYCCSGVAYLSHLQG